jgi:hypothetical protein
MRGLLIAAAASLWLTPARAQPGADNFDALRASAEITTLLARRDLDGASRTAAGLMEGIGADKLRDLFDIIGPLGQSQYIDMVYARDYGGTERDVIFKIDFAKAFLFIRYLYHVDNGAWRLIRIHVAKEDELPFPKGWAHIYPK